MQYIIVVIFKACRRILSWIKGKLDWVITFIYLYTNNVKFRDFKTSGLPYISVARSGKCIIGKGLRINNNLRSNPIGRPQRCVFFVDYGAELTIGKNVGISQTALVAHEKILIGDNVKIGGGVCIYDTDFHALDPQVRMDPSEDHKFKKKESVIIGDNVFIGAHSTILKGVTIEENAVIGACSLVSRDVPANEIWAGNPAKFIKKNNTDV